MIVLLWDDADMELADRVAFYDQHGADIGITDVYKVLYTSFPAPSILLSSSGALDGAISVAW